jgi:hypothetical protein
MRRKKSRSMQHNAHHGKPCRGMWTVPQQPNWPMQEYNISVITNYLQLERANEKDQK